MGTDHNVHIGPYVKCPIKRVMKELEVPGCPKCKSSNRYDTKTFCQDCGTKIGTFVQKQEEPTVDAFDLMEEFHERLMEIYDIDKKSNVFISNIGKHGITFDAKFSESFYTAIPAATISKEIVAFNKAFAKELVKLKEAYGEVFVEWGIIFWYS